LKPYFERFDRSQILVLFFDELCVDPVAFYAKLCEFIGVSSSFTPKSLKEKVLETRTLRLPALARRAYKVARSASPEQHAATWVNQLRARIALALQPLMYTSHRPTFTAHDSVLKQLKLSFRRDYQELERLIGRPLPQAWYQ
jgi:hypothetical protein